MFAGGRGESPAGAIGEDPRPMASQADTRRRLREAAKRAGELVAGTTTARLALAALAETVDLQAVPEEVRAPVAARLARVPAPEPLPFDRVERVLRDAWGKRAAAVLDDLRREPAAVTPGAVVHRGVLDGRDVAVKVRRPGLAEAVRSDLGLADAIVPLFGALVPRVDVGAVAREMRERILDELDLEYEGSVQRSFARALRRHPDLHVPAVHGELTHEAVLVTDWVEGVAVGDLSGKSERLRAAELLVRFHLGAARFGTVHADPHPRDALLGADGRLAVLDFGATRRVAPARVDLAVAALDALAAGDGRGLGSALASLGWLPERDGARALAPAQDIFAPLLGGTTSLDAAAARGLARRAAAQERALLALLPHAGVAPEDLWPLRMLGGLFTVLARLGARSDWLALARRALADGWNQ
jgi:ABC1 atypical kinase-like domain